MKKIRFTLIMIICFVFTYIVIEQEMGVGVIFGSYSVAESIPVSVTSRTMHINTPSSGTTDAKKLTIYENETTLPQEMRDELLTADEPDNSVVLPDDNGNVKIVVTAAGDCLLGSDSTYGFANSFMDEFERQNKDYSYFLKNFAGLFESSDLTIVNLEAPLTNSTKKAEKEFAFKGLPEFTEILKAGYVDAVTVANNHTKDYAIEGYNETLENLENSSVLYFGNESIAMTELSGIKIGMFGYSAWYIDNSIKKNISGNIEKLREMGADLVIAYYHWGDERAELPNDIQKTYAYYTIDNGADLVLGSHPHVIQGIEEYKGKQIVYSFGNFCYGGAKNPSDKDTFVFQQTFTFADGVLVADANIRIIPTSISSATGRNNYQPTPLTGSEYDRVSDKIIERSKTFNSIDKLKEALSF